MITTHTIPRIDYILVIFKNIELFFWVKCLKTFYKVPM